MKLISHSIADTDKIARDLAKKILRNEVGKHAVIIALEGELGAGKTTFVKGFARALGIKAHITSPTFVLMKSYGLPNFATASLKLRSASKASSGKQVISYKTLFHIDAYRLKNYRDLLPLSVKESISNPENIILIEWSDRVKPILPKKYIKIHIDHVSKNTRKIMIKNIYDPPSLKLRKGTSSLLCEVAMATQHERPKEMPALRSSGGAKK